MPKPVSASKPGAPRSRPERRMTSSTWLASSVGRAVQTQAAAPATIGAEKLVPDATR